MVDGVPLRELSGCFDGVIPPALATCSAAGEPNVTHLSQIYLIDDEHLAASNQFFAKTTRNLRENPRAAVLVTDSQTYDTYHLELLYERTETSGPLCDELRVSVEAIAALVHMEHVFAVRGADVYRVLSVRRVSTGRA